MYPRPPTLAMKGQKFLVSHWLLEDTASAQHCDFGTKSLSPCTSILSPGLAVCCRKKSACKSFSSGNPFQAHSSTPLTPLCFMRLALAVLRSFAYLR